MSKNELIEIIINSASINATLNTIQPYELQDDFRSHFYLQLCEKSYEKLLEAFNRCDTCLEQYAGAIIKNQLKSNNSSFHKIYRKDTTINNDVEILIGQFNKAETTYAENGFANEHWLKFVEKNIDRFNGDDTEEEEYKRRIEKNYQKVLSFLNHIHPRKSKLFIEHYVNGKTLRQISKQYKIKYTTVVYNIRQTEKLIREKLKFENE